MRTAAGQKTTTLQARDDRATIKAKRDLLEQPKLVDCGIANGPRASFGGCARDLVDVKNGVADMTAQCSPPAGSKRVE